MNTKKLLGIFLSFILILGSGALAACNSTTVATDSEITVSAGAGGTVSVTSPESASVTPAASWTKKVPTEGFALKATATPNLGYAFAGWSMYADGELMKVQLGSDEADTIDYVCMTEALDINFQTWDKVLEELQDELENYFDEDQIELLYEVQATPIKFEYKAVFVQMTIAFAAYCDYDKGDVSINGVPGTQNGAFATVKGGDQLTLAATPGTGYEFVGWYTSWEFDTTADFLSADATYTYIAGTNAQAALTSAGFIESVVARFEKEVAGLAFDAANPSYGTFVGADPVGVGKYMGGEINYTIGNTYTPNFTGFLVYAVHAPEATSANPVLGRLLTAREYTIEGVDLIDWETDGGEFTVTFIYNANPEIYVSIPVYVSAQALPSV
ncbi:MAG: InlB B-repeat-containing protein [Firmicutes bacterium]|nr:InlB B-repeat-containing protein [Bacillota bacterium]